MTKKVIRQTKKNWNLCLKKRLISSIKLTVDVSGKFSQALLFVTQKIANSLLREKSDCNEVF